jgi:hypothetical protein
VSSGSGNCFEIVFNGMLFNGTDQYASQLHYWATPDGVIHFTKTGKDWENLGTFESDCNVIHWLQNGTAPGGTWVKAACTPPS